MQQIYESYGWNRWLLNFVTVIFLSWLIQLSHAKAQHKGEQFGSAFSDIFNSLADGLWDGKCIGDAANHRKIDLTFVGIPKDDIRIRESKRQQLNSEAQKWIRKRYRRFYNVNYSQNIGINAGLLGADHQSLRSLRKSLKHHMRDAPLLLLIRTLRPFPDIVQLEVIILARNNGSSLCNRQQSFYLHIPSNRIISLQDLKTGKKSMEGNYITYEKSYTIGIDKIIGNFWNLKKVDFLPMFENEIRCSWHGEEKERFANQYSNSLEKKTSQINSNRQEWPGLSPRAALYGFKHTQAIKLGSAPLLIVKWGKPDRSGHIVRVSFSFFQNKLQTKKLSYLIVAPRSIFKACKKTTKPEQDDCKAWPYIKLTNDFNILKKFISNCKKEPFLGQALTKMVNMKTPQVKKSSSGKNFSTEVPTSREIDESPYPPPYQRPDSEMPGYKY